MKKFILLAASSVLVLAGCSKSLSLSQNENSSDNEITFQTISMPTKAGYGTNQYAFDKTKTFSTYAYYLAGNDWDTNFASGKVYINNKEVSYDTTNDLWKTATTYNWPKTGYLTFFSYTPTSVNATCTPANGISTSIDLAATPGVDFMVADIAKNKNANEKVYQWNGVPTLFRHKLAKVSVYVHEEKDYANGHTGSATNPYKDGDKVITLTGISISGYNTSGSYSQNGSPEWSGQSGTGDCTYFTGSQEVKTTTVKIGNSEIVIPQNLPANAVITVTYDITTYVDDGHGGTTTVVEHVTISRKVSDLTSSWNPGKDIQYNLNFDMSNPNITDPSDPNYGKDNIIYFDPAVQDWEAYTSDVNI